MLLSAIDTLTFLGKRPDDDFVDRLHYFVTSNLLLALSVVVSYKQFGNSPLECMVPDIFTSSWEEYAENYCWSMDTYFLPSGNLTAPLEFAQRYEKKISYYQWVPFFLLFQALCFRLPSLLWLYSAGHSGIKIHDIVKMANKSEQCSLKEKDEVLQELSCHLQRALRFHRRVHKTTNARDYLLPFNLPYSSGYITGLYLFTKLLYIVNTLLMLLLMNQFLGTDHYSVFGTNVFLDILRGTSWDETGYFPRVTLCDFMVRVVGSNIQRFSMQCVLIINIFTEKIFLFLWLWYSFLLVLMSSSITYWVSVMTVPKFSRLFISRHLELSKLPFDSQDEDSVKDVNRFVFNYLRTDGLFVLRMLTMHAGIIFGTELTLNLWKVYYGMDERFRSHYSRTISAITPGIIPVNSEESEPNSAAGAGTGKTGRGGFIKSVFDFPIFNKRQKVSQV